MSIPTNALKEYKHYTYNSDSQKYIFLTEENLGKNYILDKAKVETILKLYSNFDKQPYTSGEIAQRTSTPKKVIEFVIKALEVNHQSLPITTELLEEVDEDAIVRDLLLEKRSNISQKFDRNDWKNTQEDAEKWRMFQHNYSQVFENLLSSWKPKPYIPGKALNHKTGNKQLIVGCSDWHYGLIADERYLYNQKAWNVEETKKAAKAYAQKIIQHVKDRDYPYASIKLAYLGDLLHGLDGFTDKGTKLEAHPIKEAQLEEAFDSVLDFIQDILTVSSDVQVLAVPGNHSSFGDYFLMKMLSIFFKNDSRISFDITSKRFLTFKCFNNLFLMDHGYSAVTKSRLPAPGSGRENYINNLFMAKPEIMRDADRLYYLSGDQHHMESSELTNVETFMFSTFVGGCRYADNSGYKSRPRQSCLVVEEEGVTEFLHFYFDK